MKTNYLLNIGGRKEQQDSCQIFENEYSTFLVLGDGMGGHKGGSVASQTLINEAKQAYQSQKKKIENPKVFFQKIVDNTMETLKDYVLKNSDTDPQTTVVLALIQDDVVYSGHIGDSRLYVFEDKEFTFRTKDHSVVQMLLNLGEITEDEMGTHPDQNKLLKSLSSKKRVEISYKEIRLKKETNNAVLACSDGFWEYLSTDEMKKYLFEENLDSALLKMVSLSKERAGENGDNISVAVCMTEQKEETTTQKIMKFLNKEIF